MNHMDFFFEHEIKSKGIVFLKVFKQFQIGHSKHLFLNNILISKIQPKIQFGLEMLSEIF